ncbi:serine/threonine-protein kinase [Rathayibacter soli]|uniref:serine/threonine-protein kinase n=1 Tax=Rathayibacter soli TaxID=3144168 RepID=UPI0027E54A8C|nr:serine/threonine-protein kinase [Glaciibacter superstes]
MARRLPSQPPNLPGFSYLRVLGSGGFADVFLYEQNMPRRQVAVKVLLSEVVTPQVRQMFQAEANVMAQLSAHPSVLTVYQASVSSDGRPYLVMELCSPSLNQRYRVDPVPVPEVLRIGVKIASAVETAHRAGVLHRDIKPSNILMTAYGHPVLGDFGIASTLGEAELSDAVGLSIPWSAPEVLLDETPGSVASEIWSLGATVYSLLAGRSPFELDGKDNSPAELIGRIQKAKPGPIGRADVPPRLEAILERSMSKRPAARQGSVLEFIRELQSVEAELSLTQTQLEVAMDDWAVATASDPDDRTRVKGVIAVDPSVGKRRRAARQATRGSRSSSARTAGRESGGFSTTAQKHEAGKMSRATTWLMVACAVLIVVLGGFAAVVLVRTADAGQIPVVRNIDGHAAGSTIVFSWNDPGLQANDVYQVRVDDAAPSVQRSQEFRVDSTGSQRVCITVSVNRDGKAGEPSARKCVEPGGGS